MKLFTFFTIMLFSTAILIKAQIPNADFENWTNNGNPVGWWINNKPIFHFYPVSKTTDAHTGKFAVKGTVELFGKAMPAAPVIHTGNVKNQKFRISKKYVLLSGYYKLSSVKGDQLEAAVTMYKNGKDIGHGIETFQPAKKYSQFKVKIKYKSKVTPDECEIMFSIFPGVDGTNEVIVHKGTIIYVDSITLK